MAMQVQTVRQVDVGKQVALFAKKYLPIALRESAGFKAGDYKAGLREAFLGVDQRLASVAGEEEIKRIVEANPPSGYLGFDESVSAKQVGCTACAVLLTPKEIYVANAGDSRCVLSENGKANPLSTDHKPILEGERKRIEKAGGNVTGDRVDGLLSCSRALGDFCFKENSTLGPEEQKVTAEPEITVTAISPQTSFIVVACDGVWDVRTSEEVVQTITQDLGTESNYLNPSFKISRVVESLLDSAIAPNTSDQGTRPFVNA